MGPKVERVVELNVEVHFRKNNSYIISFSHGLLMAQCE